MNELREKVAEIIRWHHNWIGILESGIEQPPTPTLEVSGLLRWLPGHVGSTGDEAWFLELKPGAAVKFSTALGLDIEKDDGQRVTIRIERGSGDAE